MNKKGSFFLGAVFFLILFIAGTLAIPLIQDTITQTRSDMNCGASSTGLTSGEKITCLIVDTSLPYFILVFVSIALGYFGGKLL